jgi:pimeloyl-ACP methyl ester carboxylesterase
MRFISQTTSNGVSERLFTLDDITGVLWSPVDATGSRPLVLLGHGGGQHKKAPGLVARAHRYVTTHGFAVAAIDAPAHGDRPKTEQDERFSADLRQRMAAGQPIGQQVAHHNAEHAARAVPEWQATLDGLQELDYIGTGGPVGFWGVSLGSAIGVPLAAAEPRITAAVFGLVGHDTLADAAARVTVPVEFLLQWDDELVPRDSALALFDAFASRDKTLHANPGRHTGVPAFELDSSERFITRHLVQGRARAAAAPLAVAAERQSQPAAEQYRRAMPIFPGFDGAQLHYDELYRGDNVNGALPLVTLAGGAARDPSYLGDLAGLDTEQRLIVPHLRGVGRSPLPDSAEAASYWRQAEDIEQLRAHLGLERVYLLGHSAGTRLAISYAAQFPERLAGLVLVTPPAGYLVDVPSDTEELIDKRRGEPAFDAALTAWAAGPDAHDDDAFNAWWSRVAPLGYATWTATEQAHAAIGRTSFAANRAFFSVDPPHDLAERLGKVTAPVLIVAGAQDCSAGAAQGIALAKLFPAGAAVTIERCGHHPWVEQPTAFRHEIDQFLSTLPHHPH